MNAQTKRSACARFLKSLLVVCSLCFSVSLMMPAMATEHQTTAEQEDEADEILEIVETKSKAEAGDAKAQFVLAKHYVKAHPEAREDAKAYYWMKKSADQGYDRALVGMGWLYSTGRGVPHDPKQGFAWYMKAAEKGNPLAQRIVARAYEKGTGVKRDMSQAHIWYQKAADAGDSAAKKRLESWK